MEAKQVPVPAGDPFARFALETARPIRGKSVHVFNTAEGLEAFVERHHLVVQS